MLNILSQIFFKKQGITTTAKAEGQSLIDGIKNDDAEINISDNPTPLVPMDSENRAKGDLGETGRDAEAKANPAPKKSGAEAITQLTKAVMVSLSKIDESHDYMVKCKERFKADSREVREDGFKDGLQPLLEVYDMVNHEVASRSENAVSDSNDSFVHVLEETIRQKLIELNVVTMSPKIGSAVDWTIMKGIGAKEQPGQTMDGELVVSEIARCGYSFTSNGQVKILRKVEVVTTRKEAK
jgi:hypothetical protein